MNKDLEVFENRSDDWLAKERKYENTVSVWDFDDGRKLRLEHEEDCEAREIKRNHEIRHQAYNNQFTNLSDLAKSHNATADTKKAALAITLIIIFIPLVVFMIIFANAFNEEVPEMLFAIPIIAFILMINIAKKKGRNQ